MYKHNLHRLGRQRFYLTTQSSISPHMYGTDLFSMDLRQRKNELNLTHLTNFILYIILWSNHRIDHFIIRPDHIMKWLLFTFLRKTKEILNTKMLLSK